MVNLYVNIKIFMNIHESLLQTFAPCEYLQLRTKRVVGYDA